MSIEEERDKLIDEIEGLQADLSWLNYYDDLKTPDMYNMQVSELIKHRDHLKEVWIERSRHHLDEYDYEVEE